MSAPKGNKNALGNKGGRPTKYSKGVLQKTKEYIRKWGEGKLPEEVIPSVEGLAVYLDIGRRSIYDWQDGGKNVEFSHIVENLLLIQGRTLLNRGLDGKFNATISKLILSKHGYKDESDITTGGQPIKVSFDSAFEKK